MGRVKPGLWSAIRYYSKNLSYFHNASNQPLRQVTLGQLLSDAAKQHPGRTALNSKHQKVKLTYAQVEEQADQLGASFLKLGLKPGDRIAMFGGNSTYWYTTTFAAAKSGLILAGLNPNYEAAELKQNLKTIGAKAIICDQKFRETDYHQLLSSMISEVMTSPPSTPIHSRDLPELKYIIMATDEQLPGVFRFSDIYKFADNTSALEDVSRQVQPDNALNIQFTSGTTGAPKAAVLSHFGIVNNSYYFGKRCGYLEKVPNVCHQVPMFHVFGYSLGIACVTNFAGTITLPGPYFKKEFTIQTLQEEVCNVIYGTPTMYVDVCSAIEKQSNNTKLEEGVRNFTTIVTGGALCTEELFNTISKTLHCTRINSAFGLSETSPITFTNTDNDTFKQITTTIGKVAEHQEVKVVDNDGKMVPFGTQGEVWYRGYSNMLGYWDDDEKTKETITPCNWLKSGDLLILTEDGYGTVVGRKKDIIIRGGENIMPSEIEKVLDTHPDILEAHVHGASDHRLGEEVCASIRVKPGSKLNDQDVREFCKGKLARFKIPRYVRFVESFPKTGTEKIRKNILREMIDKELSEKQS